MDTLKRAKRFLDNRLQLLKIKAVGTPGGVDRWSDITSLDPSWDKRTVAIAALIPQGSSVIEFGAGRQVLKDHLVGCDYVPSDIVARSPDTLVADLNGHLPCLGRVFDYAVFSGVIEYVHDVRRLVKWLRPQTENILLSYWTTDKFPDRVTRLRNGWVNHLSRKKLIRIFERAGYELRSQHEHGRETILHFTR